MYPKKPNEVADDLESFVYVIVEGLLRFHGHDMSKLSEKPVEHPTKDGEAEPAREPPANERLTNYAASTFYETDILDGGYVAGGYQKFSQIQAGRPSFKLDNNLLTGAQMDIEGFLWQLYRLLQQHYAAIKPEELAIYRVQTAKERSYQSLAKRGGPVRTKVDRDALAAFRNRPTRPPVVRAEPVTSPELVLATHDAMMDAFLEYRLDPTADDMDMLHEDQNKTDDQFASLGRNIHVPSAGPSSGSVASSRSKIRVVPKKVPTLDFETESKLDPFVVQDDGLHDLSQVDFEASFRS